MFTQIFRTGFSDGNYKLNLQFLTTQTEHIDKISHIGSQGPTYTLPYLIVG